MQTQSRSSCCYITVIINIFYGEETLHGKSLCVGSLTQFYSAFLIITLLTVCCLITNVVTVFLLVFHLFLLLKRKCCGGLQTSSCDLQLVYIIWQQTTISQVSVSSLDRCTAGIRPAFIQTCPINHHKNLVEFSRL